MAPEESSSQQAAAVVSDLIQAWIDETQKFYDALREADDGFGLEDVFEGVTDVVGRFRPIVNRALELNIELLSPWAKAFSPPSDDA